MNAKIVRLVGEAAVQVAPFAVQVLVQSTLLIGAGLIVARLCRRHGPALESVVLRTTLVMVLGCPFVSMLLTRAGVPGSQWEMPRTDISPLVANELLPAAPSAAAVSTNVVSKEGPTSPPAKSSTPAVAPSVAERVSVPTEAKRLRYDPATKPASSWTAFSYAVAAAAWIAVGAYLLLRLTLAHRRITRLLRESDLAAVSVFESCTAIARELEISPPEVRVHTGIKSPLLIGWLRPAILLPDVKGLEEIVATREVLLHELAHRARHDCFWHLLSRTAAAAFWIQPLLWILARRIEETAEDVCDNYVIEHGRDRRAYAEQLVALAEQLQYSPAEALAGTGVIAFRSALGRRVVRILDDSRNLAIRVGFGAGIGSAAAIIMATVAISLVGVKSAARADTTITASAVATIRSLISGAGEIASGALAPDETALAYVGWGDTTSAVVVRDIKSGETRNLVPIRNNLEQALRPVWSPDSRIVAYEWNNYERESVLSVRMVSREGGEPKVIWTGATWADGNGEGFSPEDWSRDGKFLAGKFWAADKPVALATLDIATGRVHVVTTLWPMAEHVRFSPDGKFLAFERFVDGNRDIFAISIDGGKITRLTDSPAEDGTPVFSDDGKFVLFSSNRQGRWDLCAIPVKDGALDGVPISIKHGFPDATKWINAAGKLAFRSGPNGDMEVMSPDVFEVETPSPSKSLASPRPIAKAAFGRNFAPACSPDGKKIAYIRMRGIGAWQSVLCVQSVADGREELFETGLAKFVRIMWAPDNETVALRGSGPGGKWGVYLFSLTTRKAVTAPIGVDNAGDLIGFSVDGKEFVFFDRKQQQRVAVDLRSGAKRSISTRADQARPTANKALARLHTLSRDETLVAYVENVDAEQHLVVADASYRDKRVIARIPQPKYAGFGWLQLSPDKQKLAFFRRPDGAKTAELHIAATDGSWDRVVEMGTRRVAGSWAGPSWSADSRKLLVTLVEDFPAEIGMLENFLPAPKLAAR